MASVTVYPSSVINTDVEKRPATPPNAPSLVVGSLTTAQDGVYQSLIQDLETSGTVERQLIDRLMDGGEYSFSVGRTHIPLPSIVSHDVCIYAV